MSLYDRSNDSNDEFVLRPEESSSNAEWLMPHMMRDRDFKVYDWPRPIDS